MTSDPTQRLQAGDDRTLRIAPELATTTPPPPPAPAGANSQAATLLLRDPQAEKEPAPEPCEATGESWGRYDLAGTLGEGGMGVVYRAIDRELGREVALKVFQLPDGREEDRQRFINEARITSQLAHPNIVPVHDIGTTPRGELFYAMKRIRGRELSKVAREDALSLVNKAQLVIDACHALEYAHDRGVVHRDLKPDNILIGDYGELLIVDWGLARVLDGAEEPLRAPTGERQAPATPEAKPGAGAREPTRALPDGSGAPLNSQLTQVGEIVGTLSYMSPEQARGERRRVGPASDIYALGAILFELLTGRPPLIFDDSRTVREVLLELGDAPRPTPQELDPALPPDLSAIASKALAVQPGQRYPSVKALRADLEAFIEKRPVSAHQASLAFRLGKLVERHRAIVTTGLAAALLLLVALGAFAVRLFNERQATQAANAGLQAANGDLEAARLRLEQKNQELEARTRDLQTKTAELVAANEQRQRIERAETLLAKAQLALDGNRNTSEALASVEAACAEAPRYHRCHYQRARVLLLRRRPAEALEALETTLELRPDYTPALWLYVELLQDRRVRATADRRGDIQAKIKGAYLALRKHGDAAEALTAAGYLALMADQREPAGKLFRQALSKPGNKSQAREGLIVVGSKGGDAVALRKLVREVQRAYGADLVQQENLLNKLKRIGWSHGGDDNPEVAFQRGTQLYEARRYEQASASFKQAEAAYRRDGTDGLADRSRYRIALCQWQLGQRRSALETWRSLLGPAAERREWTWQRTVGNVVVDALTKLGRESQALPVLAAMINGAKEEQDLRSAAILTLTRVDTHLDLGDLESAREDLERARVLGRGVQVSVALQEARLLRLEDDPEGALELLEMPGLNPKERRVTVGDVRTAFEIAACWRAQGEEAKAGKLLDSLIRMLPPTRSPGMELRSRALVMRADQLRAAGELDKAARLLRGPKGRAYWRTVQERARIEYLDGEFERATKSVQELSSAGYDPHRTLLLRALIARKQGKQQLAELLAALDNEGGVPAEDAPWPAALVRLVLGKTDIKTAQQRARVNPGAWAEADYVIAELRLMDGKHMQALQGYRQCAEAPGLRDHPVHRNSRDRLKQLSGR